MRVAFILVMVTMSSSLIGATVSSVLATLKTTNDSISGRYIVNETVSENNQVANQTYLYLRKGDKEKQINESTSVGYIFDGVVGVNVSGNQLISTFNTIPNLVSPTLLLDLVNRGDLTLTIVSETTDSISLAGSGGGATVSLIVKLPDNVIRAVDITSTGKLLIRYRAEWINGQLQSETNYDATRPLPRETSRLYTGLFSTFGLPADTEFDVSGYLK
ncbi:hypothetical protein EB093_09575 [bacterium]|nr:hypothetical protein [bacterium]